MLLLASILAASPCDSPWRYEVNRRAYEAGRREPCSTPQPSLKAIMDEAGRQCRAMGGDACRAIIAEPEKKQ